MGIFYIFPLLIYILCITIYIKGVSSYMYFDITRYDTNITITEVFTPFVRNDKIDLLLSKEIKSPKNTCTRSILITPNYGYSLQPNHFINEIIIWIDYEKPSICQYTTIRKIYDVCYRAGGFNMVNNNFFVDVPTLEDCYDLLLYPSQIERSYQDQNGGLQLLYRFYAYHQQMLLQDTFHIKSSSDGKEHIRQQISLLNINQHNKYNYIYFYVIKMDNKWCMKFGRTDGDLYDVLSKYLFVEHFVQKKDIETFRLLAVWQFESEKIAQKYEEIIKEGFSKYPLNNNQPFMPIEQYSFVESWNLSKDYIHGGFIFSNYGWVHPNLDIEVKNIMTNSKIVD